ncbi:hypothetical protein GCM10023187_29080 [Nibrella viscosa]|uniref:DUF433 domain-containing protein n=1 Tax=Nibrella viscosa TaxID=1084524 RepID=A0ABP8KIK6_9BACT
MLTAKQVITVDPEIMGGTPVFTGTRVSMQRLSDYLETSFLEGYPSVSRKQAEIIELAGKLLQTFSAQYEGTV